MKIFLATHGHMASGMKSSLDILLGSSDNLTAFDAYVEGQQTSVEENVEKFLNETSESETRLLVSDMYGGSVNQVLARYGNRENTFVITGINLSLLLDLVIKSNQETVTEEELEHSIERSRGLTKMVSLDFEVKKDDFF